VGIFYQVQLFSQSSVVIAQHGDILANAFFMRNNRRNLSGIVGSGMNNLNNSGVVEILPPSGGENNRFRNLAAYCQLRYESVTEDSDSGEVNVDRVVKLVESLFHATAPNNNYKL
jgi:capsular polysaccharide biosynthesis protein